MEIYELAIDKNGNTIDKRLKDDQNDSCHAAHSILAYQRVCKCLHKKKNKRQTEDEIGID